MKIEGGGFDSLVSLTEGFGPALQKEAAYAATNTVKFHKKQIAKSVTKHVALKQKDVKEVIDVERASRGRQPTASLTVNKTKRLSLKRFGARQTKSGVSYRISKTGKRGKIHDAFGPKIPRLGNHVFRRKGKGRLPIVKLYGASVAGVYGKQQLIKISKVQLEERLAYELNRRVRAVKIRLLRRQGRKDGLSKEQINQQIANL